MLMTFYVTKETVCTSPSTTINCDDNQLITNHIMNFAASHNLAMVSTLSWETVILLIMILSSELTHALTSAVPMHTLSALMKQWPDKLTLDGFVWRRSHWPISRPHAPAAVNQSVVGVSPALFLFFFLPLAGVYNEAISSELRNNSVTYQLVRVYTILFYIYCAQFLGYHSLHLFFSFSSSKCFCLLILVLFPLFFFHWGGVDIFSLSCYNLSVADLIFSRRFNVSLVSTNGIFPILSQVRSAGWGQGAIQTRNWTPPQRSSPHKMSLSRFSLAPRCLRGEMLLDWAGALDATPPKLESCWASDNEALQGQWSHCSEIQKELAVPFPTQLRTRTLVSFQ